MQIVPLEQNTPEWLEWRKGKATASQAAIIMGAAPKLLGGAHVGRPGTGPCGLVRGARRPSHRACSITVIARNWKPARN